MSDSLGTSFWMIGSMIHQPQGHVTRQRDGTTLKIRTPFPLLEAPVRGCERAFSRVVMRARRLSEFDKRWKRRSSLPLWVAGALS
jgi:hypothetical protein